MQKLFVSVIIFSLLFIKSSMILDPDFGWHLRMGQVILEKGIPKTDPFSYTMPSFPFVDHEWLSNMGIALLYPVIGITGLAMLASVLATSALYIQLPSSRTSWAILPYLLCAGVLVFFIGVRPQVITWFLFSILLRIIVDKKLWQKFRFGIPFLCLFWVNLHGAFASGLAALFVAQAARTWMTKKIYKADIIVLLLSILATLVNPYAVQIWREVWMQISDGQLRWSIAEWMPALADFDLLLWAFFCLSVTLVWRYKKKFTVIELALYGTLLLAGQSSLRHIPLWLLSALPLTSRALWFFYQEVTTLQDAAYRFVKAAWAFCIFIAVLAGVQLLFDFQDAYALREAAFYPTRAVTYLQRHVSQGNIFSSYSWGGYLIWKLPEKKVFVDGRMPSWSWDGAPVKESRYAFKEYQGVVTGTLPFKEIAKKYTIDTILLPVATPQPRTHIFDGLRQKMDAMIVPKQNKKKFYSQLIQNGFVAVYKDASAIIYQKK